MYVVLDTNIVVAEGFGDSALFRFFLFSSNLVGHRITVPEVVVEEAIRRFRDRLDQESKLAKKSLDSLSRLLSRPVPSLEDFDIEKEVAAFRERITRQFSSSNCSVLEYPNTQHRELVSRAMDRHKPFSDKGSGYRDALIWSSILELACRDTESIILLSSNTKDFGDSRGGLHSSLVNEIVQSGHGGDKVILVSSLKEFVYEHIKPQLRQISGDGLFQALREQGIPFEIFLKGYVHGYYDGLFQALREQGIHSGIDLKRFVHGFYDIRDIYPEELNLASKYMVLSFSKVKGISGANVTDAREVSASQSFFQIYADIDCEFEVLVRASDAFSQTELAWWTLRSSGLNADDYVRRAIDLRLRCDLRLTVQDLGSKQYDIQELSMELEAAEELAAMHDYTPPNT